MTTPRTLIGCSVFALALSAALGLLNVQRTRAVRVTLAQNGAAHGAEAGAPAARAKEVQTHEAIVAALDARLAESRARVASIEAELLKAHSEKNDLQAKLQANEARIAELEEHTKDMKEGPVVDKVTETISTAELQAQLEDARMQLKAAESENAFLSERIKGTQERSGRRKSKRRPTAGGNPGIRGRVLAVNQAYNFVVLNLGGREGVEPNTEMLVLRGGSLIGKIRVSSVEPATTIGDIVTTSLAVASK